MGGGPYRSEEIGIVKALPPGSVSKHQQEQERLINWMKKTKEAMLGFCHYQQRNSEKIEYIWEQETLIESMRQIADYLVRREHELKIIQVDLLIKALKHVRVDAFLKMDFWLNDHDPHTMLLGDPDLDESQKQFAYCLLYTSDAADE